MSYCWKSVDGLLGKFNFTAKSLIHWGWVTNINITMWGGGEADDNFIIKLSCNITLFLPWDSRCNTKPKETGDKETSTPAKSVKKK